MVIPRVSQPVAPQAWFPIFYLSLRTLIMTLTGEVERKKSNKVYRIKNSSTEQRLKEGGGGA